MSAAIPKTGRLDVRVRAPVKQLLSDAAAAAHKSVSEFVLDAGIAAANQLLEERRRFDLPADKWAAFQAALEAPVKRRPRLKRLLNEPGLLG